MKVEINVVNCGAIVESAHRQNHGPVSAIPEARFFLPFGRLAHVGGLQIPPDHCAYEGYLVGLCNIVGSDFSAIPQHRRDVAQLFHLFKAVGDVDKRQPVRSPGS